MHAADGETSAFTRGDLDLGGGARPRCEADLQHLLFDRERTRQIERELHAAATSAEMIEDDRDLFGPTTRPGCGRSYLRTQQASQAHSSQAIDGGDRQHYRVERKQRRQIRCVERQPQRQQRGDQDQQHQETGGVHGS